MDCSSDHVPIFHRDRHVKYHLRCLKTLLPTLYTTNDSNRMLLAFLTLNALDLLSVLEGPQISDKERQDYIDWIYHCQISSGGFRGFTGADLGLVWRQARRVSTKESHIQWDPPNLAGTFFALVSLIVLGDDLRRVNRAGALTWLRGLQWTRDGSFGEIIGPNGQPEGERDIRFCYMAAAIRYILRHADEEGTPDFSVDRLASFVLSSQAYDGGFGRQPMYEGNAGWTYCAVACLHLLGRLPTSISDSLQTAKTSDLNFSMDRLLHWLTSLQVDCPEDEDEDETDSENGESHQTYSTKEESPSDDQADSVAIDTIAPLCAGLNGRCNKTADTCYSFWAVGALKIIGHVDFINKDANRRFLLERTQHSIGGFGKTEGDPPGEWIQAPEFPIYS